MALNVYTRKEDIPDGMFYVNDNDKLFVPTDFGKLDFVKDVICYVDKGSYESGLYFLGRDKDIGLLSLSCLSTGSKTLINIFNNPDKCFDISCCGTNAKLMLGKLHSGNIYWRFPVVIRLNGFPWECDINMLGRHFSNFGDLTTFSISNRIGS